MERPEVRLLLACCRPPSLRADDLVRELVTEGVDWTDLVALALQHGVAPALARGLGAVASHAPVPADIEAALDQYCAAAREGNSALARELRSIVQSLAADGIVALPFKGPMLADLAYGDLGQRAPGDLDILVRLGDVTRTCEALIARGYRDAHRSQAVLTAAQHDVYRRYQCEYQFVRDDDGVVVEPHWAFAQRMWAIDLDYEAQFHRARGGTCARAVLPMQAPEDLLLMLCVHGAKHEWERLVWVRDVAALLDRGATLGLDLDLALVRAQQQGCARLLLVGLEVVCRLLAAPLSPAVHRAVQDDPVVGALSGTVLRRLFDPTRPARSNRTVNDFAFRIHEGAARRARYVGQTMLLPRREHIEMVALPAWLAWLYYPLRWGHDYVALPLWTLVVRYRQARSRDPRGTAAGRRAR